MDMLRLELGYGLLPLINYEKGHRITEQIKALQEDKRVNGLVESYLFF